MHKHVKIFRFVLLALLIFLCASAAPRDAFSQTATVQLSQGLDNTARGAPIAGDIPMSNCIFAAVLVANTSQQFTVPTGADHVIFSAASGISFFVAFTSSAISVPSASITNGTSPVANPSTLRLGGATSISIVSGSAAVVTMAFYK